MDTAEKIVQMLQTYGAWGMVVILLGGVYGLWCYSCRILERRHKEFTTVLEETTKALAATAQAQERTSKTLEKATEVLEKTQESNAAVMQVVQFCQSRDR